jgi:hypothetical protein
MIQWAVLILSNARGMLGPIRLWPVASRRNFFLAVAFAVGSTQRPAPQQPRNENTFGLRYLVRTY